MFLNLFWHFLNQLDPIIFAICKSLYRGPLLNVVKTGEFRYLDVHSILVKLPLMGVTLAIRMLSYSSCMFFAVCDHWRALENAAVVCSHVLNSMFSTINILPSTGSFQSNHLKWPSVIASNSFLSKLLIRTNIEVSFCREHHVCLVRPDGEDHLCGAWILGDFHLISIRQQVPGWGCRH